MLPGKEGFPGLPGWVRSIWRWFQDVFDIEKLWSYWPHGGYLLPVGQPQHCLTAHLNIQLIAALSGLKTDSRPTCGSLQPFPDSEIPTPKIWGLLVLRFGGEK